MTPAKANPSSNSWTLRLFTLMLWLAVGLCAAYWAFKFVTTKPVEATAAAAAPAVVVDSKAVAKLLGATDAVAVKPVNVVASTKFVLFGLAATTRGQGVALIALDGKPARPYRVGSMVADDLVLKSISKTGVMLAASTTATEGVTLELPDRKPANIVPITPRFTAPNAPNPTSGTTLAPAFNTAMPAGQPPSIPPALPTAVPPGAAAAAAAAVGTPPISRFAPQMGEGTVPGRIPPTATSSATGERY
jgi:general secretion pathway protein C